MDISIVHAFHLPLQCSLEIYDFEIETEDSYTIPLLIVAASVSLGGVGSLISVFSLLISYFIFY